MVESKFTQDLVQLKPVLSRYAYSLTSNRDAADDLLQDTMFKALTHKEQFSESTNLKAWTYTIMKNTFINNYRRNIRHNTTFDNSKDMYLLSQNKEKTNISPDSTIASKEITKAIDMMADEFRIPFKMHIEGYKYKEIADKLDLKLGTVKSRIFFTRKKLMDTLK